MFTLNLHYHSEIHYPSEYQSPFYGLSADPALSMHLLMHILSFIKNPQEIAILMLVNKSFFEVFSQKILWKNIAQTHFPTYFYNPTEMQKGSSWYQTVQWMFKDYYSKTKLADGREKELRIAAKSSDIDQLRAHHFAWGDIVTDFDHNNDGEEAITSIKSLFSIITTYADQPVRDYVFNEMILPFFPAFKSRNDLAVTFTYLDLESWNILQYAAAFNQINFIKNLKKMNLISTHELNSLAKYNTTLSPIKFAALSGHLEMVKLLLSLGNHPTPEDGYGPSALNLAIAGRHLNVARYLIGTDSANMSLVVAGYFGHADIVQALLREGALIDTRTETGETALLCAAKLGHYKAFKILFEADADFTLADGNRQTALSYAVANKDYRMVEHFIPFKKAFKREAASRALDNACLNNDMQMIELLLSPAPGVDINNDLFRQNLMFSAATHGKAKLVSALIEAGHPIHVLHPRTQRPLLLVALLAKNIKAAKVFAKAGCVRNTVDPLSRKSTLYYAALSGNTFIVDQLLKNNHVSKNDLDTALYVAAKRGHISTVRLLALAGADTSRFIRSHSIKIIFDILKAFINLDVKEFKKIARVLALSRIYNLRLLMSFELEKYIVKTANREENHYKRKFTLFGKTINFGYSSTEKLAAATTLKLVSEGEDPAFLKAHKGALNNGELKTIYHALRSRR